MNLEDKVSQLERKVAQLEKENKQILGIMTEIMDKCDTLGYIKMADPRYPYDNWMMSAGITEENTMYIRQVLEVLTMRLKEKDVKNEIKRYIPNVDMDKLCINEVPSYEETKEILVSLLKWDMIDEKEKNNKKVDNIIIAILKQLHKQGEYNEFCNYILKDIGEYI